MDRQRFEDYIAAYNAADWPTVAGYYTDDIRFQSFGHLYEGSEVLRFLTRLHQGVRDTMTLRTLEISGARIDISADTLIVALVDLPDLLAGSMTAGEQRTVSMDITYETRGDRICAITVSARP